MIPYARLLILAFVLWSAAEASAAGPCCGKPVADDTTIANDMPGSEFQLDRRLVAAGESVTFSLREATPEDRFEIFPRYLERCDPERARQSPSPLQWLDDLDRETLPAANVVQYVPRQPGNYLARGRANATESNTAISRPLIQPM